MNLHNTKISNYLLLSFIIYTLNACVAIPAPDTEISNAAIAIESASLNGAVVLAPIELDAAKNKLNAAKIAVKKREHTVAKQLAEQAYSDAILARAIVVEESSRETAEHMADSLRLLEDKIKKSGK